MSALPAARRPRPHPTPSPAARPDLRVVSAPGRAGRYVILLTLLGATGIFGCVALNALAAEEAFASRTLEAEVAELSLRYDELTVDVAALEAPQRIRRVARSDLGMVPASRPVFLTVDDRVRAASRASGPRPGNLAAPPAGADAGG